jgi:hypothetical protein
MHVTLCNPAHTWAQLWPSCRSLSTRRLSIVVGRILASSTAFWTSLKSASVQFYVWNGRTSRSVSERAETTLSCKIAVFRGSIKQTHLVRRNVATVEYSSNKQHGGRPDHLIILLQSDQRFGISNRCSACPRWARPAAQAQCNGHDGPEGQRLCAEDHFDAIRCVFLLASLPVLCFAFRLLGCG